MITTKTTQPRSVMIIGAGPNGLAAAAFLREAGINVSIHGKPMESWKEKMPKRMILRSSKISSSIASPGNTLSIERYERETANCVDIHPTIRQFIDYTDWVQAKGALEVQPEKVTKLEIASGCFSAALDNGRIETADAVILAPGINPFSFIPPEFKSLPEQYCTHVSQHTTFEPFQDKRVAIIGKGQSALEAAALIQESGGQVELLTRGANLNFITGTEKNDLWARIRKIPAIYDFLYPPTDLAGPPNNWVIADPVLYRSVPEIVKDEMFRLVGPIGSPDLQKRLVGVKVTTGVKVEGANILGGDQLCLILSDGTQRAVDHVILGTGYRPEINRVEYLSPDLKKAIAQVDGYPILSLGYESTSVKGLYILGALASLSQGPINRFVCGTSAVGQYLTEAITGSKIGYPERGTRWQVAGRRWLYRINSLPTTLGMSGRP